MVPALLTLALMGFVAALGLAVASRVFYVEIDPRVEAITELLPGANCGACGYAGCSGLAAAIVKGEGKIENCTAIGEQAALAIAGRELELAAPDLVELVVRDGRAELVRGRAAQVASLTMAGREVAVE